MSLLKYLTKKDAKGDSRLPSPADVSNASSLLDKDRDQVSLPIRQTALKDNFREAESRTGKARGPYNHYTAEERAQIGRYAGPTNASRHFPKLSRSKRSRLHYSRILNSSFLCIHEILVHNCLFHTASP